MMISVLAFTVVGSYVSSLVPSTTMGIFSFMTFILGIKFIVRPVMTTKEAMAGVSAKKACTTVSYMWCFNWIYMWLHWCRWWHDDVTYSYISSWI